MVDSCARDSGSYLQIELMFCVREEENVLTVAKTRQRRGKDKENMNKSNGHQGERELENGLVMPMKFKGERGYMSERDEMRERLISQTTSSCCEVAGCSECGQ